MSGMSTGQIVGGIAGGVIGFFVGGGPMGAVQGYAIGSSIGGYIDPPPGPNLRGPTLDDKSFQSSAYGVSIPTLYGTIATVGNFIYLENNEYLAISKKESQGGKGGGGAGTYETTTYYATFAILIGEAVPGSKIRRIWAGAKLMYSAASNDIGTTVQSEIEYGIFDKITGADELVDPGWVYYDGTQTEPDSRMEAVLGVGNCPSYEGSAYIMFYDFELTDFGNGLAGCPIKVEIVDSPADEPWRVIYESSSVMPGNLPSGDGGPQYYEYPVCMYPANGITYQSFSPCIVPSFYSNLSRSQIRFSDNRTELKVSGLACRVLSVASAITDKAAGYYHYNYLDGNPLRRYTGVLAGGSKLENGFKYYPLVNDLPYAIVNKVFDAYGASQLFLMRANGSAWPPGDSESDGGWFLAYAASNAILHRFNFYADDFGIIAVGDGIIARILFESGSSYRVYLYDIGDPVETKSFLINIPGVSGTFDFTTSAYFKFNKLYVLATRGDDLEAGDIRILIIDYVLESCTVNTVTVDPMLGSQPFTFFNVIGENTLSVSVSSGINSVKVFIISSRGLAENSSVLVRDICADRFEKAGVFSANRDFSQLTDDIDVLGYRLSESMSARAATSQLQARYLFDFVEIGYKIKAVMREISIGNFIDVDIGDLCLISDGCSIKSTSDSVYQLPSSYSISYLDIEREYDQNTQIAPFPAQHENSRSESLSIVMSASDAASTAEKLINLSWAESKKYEIKLPQKYLGVSVGDHLRIRLRASVFDFLRVDSRNVNIDQSLNLQCTYASPDIYSLYSDGSTGDSVPVTNANPVYPTSSVLLDVPMIIDAQNAPGFVAAPYGGGSGWKGAILMRSDDAGQRYNGQYRFFDTGTIGQAANIIPANSGLIMDRSSGLLVWPLSGIAFESITEEAMMTGRNYVAYGAPGRWEICCYSSAVLQSSGYYLLSTMIRGMRGTEWATGLHEIGDFIVLLDDSSAAFIGADLSSIGVNKKYKTVSVGQNVASAEAEDFVYYAANLRPLAPVNPVFYKSGNDWNFSVSERSRFLSSFWVSGIQPVRDESIFSMRIYNSSGIAVRTIGSATPSFIYTSAQQIDDFGVNQSSLTVDIYQNSATAGAGFPLRVTT